MSEDAVIRAEKLGKKYLIGHPIEHERYTLFRDALARGARAMWRKTADMARGRPIVRRGGTVEEIWALKDVSFEVMRGEVLGVIGRNGAGKTTLLKILSRISEASEGRVTIKGRVASLLEVGAGFHPELTGRENIYLNGAILGMTRAEIRSRFDEIVAFAEVEKFLDTPVKRYSSGMYVRLAFAVAAHVEADILIADEILAVGDAEFQKKCLGKMKDVAADGGRAVLFVSHNIGSIRSLCQKGLVLHNGLVYFSGAIDDAVVQYHQLADSRQFQARVMDHHKPRILNVTVDENESSHGNLKIKVDFTSPWPLRPVLIGAVVRNRFGVPIFGLNSWQNGCEVPQQARSGRAILHIHDLPLHSGVYTIAVFLGEKDKNYDVVDEAGHFTFFSLEPLPVGLSVETIGPLRLDGRWQFEIDQ